MASQALTITPVLRSPTMVYIAESNKTVVYPITPSSAIVVKVSVADA